MVIEVMFLHVTEIWIAKIVEMGRVMNLLLSDVGLESRGHDN